MFIPSMLLKQLYTRGSLNNTERGIEFSIKNRLKDAEIKELLHIKIDGKEVDLSKVVFNTNEEKEIYSSTITKDNRLSFPLRKTLHLEVLDHPQLAVEKHDVEVSVKASPFGTLKFSVTDSISTEKDNEVKVPRDDMDDYGEEIIKTRQKFVEDFSGAKVNHIGKYSIDPHELNGNIEHFTGVAQIPMGFAGPVKINGEHAIGDFMVPMATTEGTLVASYNRGMKIANLCGGIKVSVVDDAMQRAPVFEFEDARGARDFVTWVKLNFKKIKEEAESTSSIADLVYIDHFLSNKFAFLRFNFKTGDAAGQNMVGRATFAACSWILDQYMGIKNFFLESNFATDKKASQINIMRTRGKRVTAEITLKKEVLQQYMRVDPEQLDHHARISAIGSFLSGVNNTGLHSPNGITAMFIATGQDVANVSESSAGIIYTELTKTGDLYFSITIPSLIIATYGGGTGIGTQKESLELMNCYGKGKAYKFAEIVAGVVLAGEISLASAISSSDWVSSHEQYGRNR
ncbi:hydroxymethylglutaryl-CoA reductase [Flammeovirga kamogawensis]|uniref:hydroxymethylglutaryl-CoA reductase (NADPH) n=1 Tax=Flammeovirga kamogawensis TaxID=373891 RepID=A0ABX8GW96_9BACT|nr:hydroxymethylglutaryl-CoA reductase [Flammeovirga kamogawensis]MBB6461657.1 hydroxymethylglutaryl-CoA reductase (NADPH) [Flammeovirga kamogawensis]QWG07417.1 hydroxymethylglutaryl-CoA reductase [Flammeovirga kamogawensis]TRX69228.1 hydroxymethylglutaryl-CoA reductase [Flammeovirga kamogawensis]